MVFAVLALLATPAWAETPEQVALRYKLAGEVLVAKGDAVLLDKGYGTVAPAGGPRHVAGQRWRLASITKQVTAALIVADAARMSREEAVTVGAVLDRPVAATFGQPGLGALTTRQLLTHHSGLANPDDTPMLKGNLPAFYTKAAPDLRYCFSKPANPGAPFAYNNCDYLVASMGLVGGERRWPDGMTMARAGDRLVPGFIGDKPEPALALASFGAAGGLTATARNVFAFDRALMTGKLLSPDALAELWKPEGGRSYQALGQWVFPGTLKGCAKPKRIVQRDGEIGGVQTRNYILPDDDLVVIVFTNRGSDDFAIGEIWQGKGFAYDLLSAVACA